MPVRRNVFLKRSDKIVISVFNLVIQAQKDGFETFQNVQKAQKALDRGRADPDLLHAVTVTSCTASAVAVLTALYGVRAASGIPV